MLKFLIFITISIFVYGLFSLVISFTLLFKNPNPNNLAEGLNQRSFKSVDAIFDASSTKEVPIKYFLKNDLLLNHQSYSYQVPDFQKHSQVKITQMRIDNKINTFIQYVDKDGFIVQKNGEKIYQDTNFGYGELFFMVIEPYLQSDDHCNENIKGIVSFAPRPLETSDKNGHYLAISSKNPEGKEFYIKLSGFQPHEIVQFESISCEEKINNVITMSAEGDICIMYEPGVIGEIEGPFKLKFYNETTNLFLQHYWGVIAFTRSPEYHTLKKKFPDFFKN